MLGRLTGIGSLVLETTSPTTQGLLILAEPGCENGQVGIAGRVSVRMGRNTPPAHPLRPDHTLTGQASPGRVVPALGAL